eukprot:3303729-Prymnesium_polylepis.1
MEPVAREEATIDSATAAHQRLPVISTQQDLGVLAAARAAGSPVCWLCRRKAFATSSGSLVTRVLVSSERPRNSSRHASKMM